MREKVKVPSLGGDSARKLGLFVHTFLASAHEQLFLHSGLLFFKLRWSGNNLGRTWYATTLLVDFLKVAKLGLNDQNLHDFFIYITRRKTMPWY